MLDVVFPAHYTVVSMLCQLPVIQKMDIHDRDIQFKIKNVPVFCLVTDTSIRWTEVIVTMVLAPFSHTSDSHPLSFRTTLGAYVCQFSTNTMGSWAIARPTVDNAPIIHTSDNCILLDCLTAS
jgi:hypothetical protein